MPRNYAYRTAKCCLKKPITLGQEATWVPTAFANTPQPFVNVSEPGLDGFGVDAGGNEQAGMRVGQVVEANVG